MPPEEEQQNNQGHPAYQEILDALPEDLHGVVLPKLKEWDQGVQQKLTEVRSQFDPYKPIFDNNIPFDRIEQALTLAATLEENPEALVERAIEHFNLEKFKQQQIDTNNSNEDDEDDLDMSDGFDLEALKKDPTFKSFFEKQQQLEEYVNSMKAEKETQTAQEQLDEYLNGLREEKGDFDNLYVTTLMANGFSAEDAIKQFQDTVSQAASKLSGGEPNTENNGQNNDQSNQPPVVMGAGGTTGSGVPDGSVKMGSLKDSEIDDMVLQILEQQNAQS